jgi:hypothetical protein
MAPKRPKLRLVTSDHDRGMEEAARAAEVPVPPGTTVETILFVADKPDLFGLVFSRAELVKMLPKIRAKPSVLDAWMDGDKLVARLKSP